MSTLTGKRIASRKAHITKRSVDALQPAEKPYIAWDDRLTGFGVRVLPSATKSFILNYRPGPGGRKAPNRRIVLGRCGIITPDQARRMAHEMLGRVAAGQDPAAERARARAVPTLREAFEEYLGAGPERKASTIASYRSTVCKDLASWLARPLDTISRKDVEQCFNRQAGAILERRLAERGRFSRQCRLWVFPSESSPSGRLHRMQHLNARIGEAGGARFWFHALRTCFIAVAEHELELPGNLTGRLVNSARPRDVTGGHAADWTMEQLREGAQRIADRIDELAGA